MQAVGALLRLVARNVGQRLIEWSNEPLTPLSPAYATVLRQNTPRVVICRRMDGTAIVIAGSSVIEIPVY